METEVVNESSRVPDDYNIYEEIMSNYDGKIDNSVAEYIKNKPLYSTYPAWNFCGYVWWQSNKWCCEIWVYGSYRCTIIKDTLKILWKKLVANMDMINKKSPTNLAGLFL